MSDVTGINAIPRTKTLKNGAIYDLDKKRIVSGATWSSEQASQLQAVAVQNKRRAIAEAANRMAESGDSLSGVTYTGDMAFVQAIAEAQFVKASNPDDPKATDAARFLLAESGIAEPKQLAQTGTGGATITLSLGADALDAVRMLLDAVARSQRDVVDGTAQDADT